MTGAPVTARPQSPFFEGIAQVELEYDGHSGRLPLFFTGGTSMTAMFPARLGALRRLLPDRRLAPARVAPSVGLVAVMAVDYHGGDAGAYQEVLVGVVLSGSAGSATPLVLLRGLARRSFHVHVVRMPVTTERALATGRRFWNYPKFVADIEIREHQGRRSCTLSERGLPILELDAPQIRAPMRQQIQYLASTYMDGQPQVSEFRVDAQGLGVAPRPGSARLSLGDSHPMAREMAGVLIGRRALGYSWVPSFQAILFGPERMTPTLVAALGEQVSGVQLPPLPERAPEREGPG